jgi:predicted PurR-regulated permease PerM
MSRVLLPFVMAAIVALLCAPLIDRVRQRTGWPRSLVAWLLFVLLLSGAALLGWLLIPPLLQDLLGVGADLQGATQTFLQGLLQNRLAAPLDLDSARLTNEMLERLHNWVGGNPLLALGALGMAGIFGCLLFWVLLAYFLADEPRIRAGLFWLVPPAKRSFARGVWQELAPTLRRYFGGVALIVAYTSLAAYLGLGGFLGLHHALLLALLTGILELVPMVGPLAAALIAGLIAIGQSGGGSHVMAYVGYAIALRISIDQLVGPIVLGRSGRISPVLVIFCFLTGGVLFGITGVIVAVPVALAIRSVLSAHYQRIAAGAS